MKGLCSLFIIFASFSVFSAQTNEVSMDYSCELSGSNLRPEDFLERRLPLHAHLQTSAINRKGNIIK